MLKYTIRLLYCVLLIVTDNQAIHADQYHRTALDHYIQQPDPAYNYTIVNREQLNGYSIVTIAMDSVQWRTQDEVDRTLWQHTLRIIIPDNVAHKNALMWIAGGNNKSYTVQKNNSTLAGIALKTQSLVAEVKMIPNQRIKFSDETDPRYIERGRKEDELIAYAWDKYLTTLDATWLPRLPMTKAVVRAMDTVQSEYPDIEGFVVGGASKRGWTTWTAAAVDRRVIAAIPVVIDVPNVIKNMQHHFDVYGHWSDAIHDYEDMGLMDKLHTKEFKKMTRIIDPIYYFNRLKMPKFIINSTGDQFFLPDSSQFYFDALKKEKYLRYVPNTDHGLNSEAYNALTAFYYSVLNQQPRPKYHWKKFTDGSIKVMTSMPPSTVRLWQANNPRERNFRLDVIGTAWHSTPLSPTREGVYWGKISPPESGWTAFMIELEYRQKNSSLPLIVTTEVSVIPCSGCQRREYQHSKMYSTD